MAEKTIICKYAYSGNSSQSFEELQKKPYPEEKWEITVGEDSKGCFINGHNIDQNFSGRIAISVEQCNAILFSMEQNFNDYIKTIYEEHKSKCKKAGIN
ncbi:hypothetical protein AGMMS49579_21370 [Spirochaetia bacterium]|nr:hypothetical protein AGMMS49579_21370 [Spirochaetia bacterium]